MTSTTDAAAIHFGDDLEEITAIWDGAIEDTIYAIEEGYLDNHLGALVKACIDRRKHLAEHGAVPALNLPATVSYKSGTVTEYISDWNEQKVTDAVNRDAKSITATGYGFQVGAASVTPYLLRGKVCRLASLRNLTGVAAKVVKVNRTTAEVILLERPQGVKADLVAAFESQSPIRVPGAALVGLMADATV